MLPQNGCPALIQETATILRSGLYKHYWYVARMWHTRTYVCTYISATCMEWTYICVWGSGYVYIIMLHGTVFSHHYSNGHWFVVVLPSFGCDSHKVHAIVYNWGCSYPIVSFHPCQMSDRACSQGQDLPTIIQCSWPQYVRVCKLMCNLYKFANYTVCTVFMFVGAKFVYNQYVMSLLVMARPIKV